MKDYRLAPRFSSRFRWFVAPAVLLLASSAVAQQIAQPRLTMPRFASSGVTEEYFSIDLTNGRVTRVDQLRREPLDVRFNRGEVNLFQAIGRPASQPAQPGEMLLLPLRSNDGSVRTALFVETLTGYTAFFDEVGRGDKLGEIVTTIGRPFGPLASGDLNFVLLGRRESNGQTVGAYLYHGTTGKGLYIGGLDEIVPDPPVTATSDLPTSTGYITATEITTGERTDSFLVIDSGTGGVFFLQPGARPEQLVQRQTSLKLFEDFAAEKLNPAPRRFYPVPLQNGDDTTTRVLVIDVGSGRLGLLDGLRSPEPTLALLPQNLYDILAGGIQENMRHFEVIPAVDGDGTRGAWLLDNLTSGTLYVERPDSPAALRIRPVSVGR